MPRFDQLCANHLALPNVLVMLRAQCATPFASWSRTRRLRRSPSPRSALGIGGAAAMFGLIQGVLLSPPPYAEPDRLVLLSPARLDGSPYAQRPTTAQWLAWRASSPRLETALYRWTFNFLVRNDGSTSLGGMVVTPDYFRVLGLTPVRGREFLASEAASSGPPTAVIIGYELWQRTFNGDPDIIGRTLQISRMPAPLPVVGVMPPGVRFLPDPANVSEPGYDVDAHVDFWLPALADESQLTRRNVERRRSPCARDVGRRGERRHRRRRGPAAGRGRDARGADGDGASSARGAERGRPAPAGATVRRGRAGLLHRVRQRRRPAAGARTPSAARLPAAERRSAPHGSDSSDRR